MSTFAIPRTTIPAGVTVVGPTTPGAGLAGMELQLEIGALVAPCTFQLEVAFDGVTWQSVNTTTVMSGITRDRQGNPVTPSMMDWQASFGSLLSVPTLTTAASMVRLRITNTTAFVSQGGSLITA